MFQNLFTKNQGVDDADKIKKIQSALAEADAVIIGAGAGLSTSAGFTYTGERFHKYFFDFEEKYGFHDMYTGGFYPYHALEEHWAYWSRYIYINRYLDAPRNTYANILEVVKNKDYFVLTTNVDHCFQKAGFDHKRLFYTQGDYGLFQCSGPCCKETFDNKEIIINMLMEQGFSIESDGTLKLPEQGKLKMTVSSSVLPVCPHCGKPLTMNLRSDDTFVEDTGWNKAAMCYDQFLQRHKGLKMVFLELGVGYNTPVIIKYPFWQMTAKNPNATYICINDSEAFCPEDIERQAICIDDDIDSVFHRLMQRIFPAKYEYVENNVEIFRTDVL